MSDRRPLLPDRNLEHRPVERYHRPGYQDGHQRVPSRRDSKHAPLPPSRQPYHRPGYQNGHQRVSSRQEYRQASPPRELAYHSLPDPRLPASGTYPTTPFDLSSPDGFAMHSLLLLSPTSPEVTFLMETARKSRMPTSHIPAEDIVERALENGILTHVSDGPSGGIFALEGGREDVIICLVDEMKGGWELLGVGQGGSEGMVFLKHPCGFGPEDEEDKEKDKGKQKAGSRVGAL